MEESGINQSQGNQTAAASGEAWRDRRRENDRRYRERQRVEKRKLKDENDQLKQEIREKDEQEQLMKSKLKRVEAKNKRLKCELKDKKQLIKSLSDIIGVVKEQQISTTTLQPLLAKIDQVVHEFGSLNRKVDEVQQHITQPPGAHVDAQPLQPQQNILINQGSQAAVTTLPLTHPAGTSTVQQTFQSSGTFTEYSHGLPDFSLQEQLGQTAHTINVLPEFGLHQGQGENTAVESQPFTQRLSDQDANLDEFFDSFYQHFHTCGIVKKKERKHALVRNHARSTELCQEDQQMKSNIEAFKAESKRLKREIKEKERQIKFNLRAFLVNCMIFKDPVQEKRLLRLMLDFDNSTLEREIEEKERLMKSNMEALEADLGGLKLKIGEKKQPMKSNLEAFEAQNERLKREIEEKKQLMKSNLLEFEAENGRLEHEIQAKEQLVKSNLEILGAQIRRLVDEFESLNVDNVLVNIRMQPQSGEASLPSK